jgi:MFS family permease
MGEAVLSRETPVAPEAQLRKVTPAYRGFALGLLTFIYAVNFLDRQIVTNLIEPIKDSLQLTDSQVGAMAGLWFALLYTILGIPIARLADKGDRPMIITISLLVWSSFTLFGGFARNFLMLGISRMGVGIGEAGCTPTAHSLITEYFPKEKRARAVSIYSMGISVGSLLGMALGGLIAGHYGKEGWRIAFWVAGSPGLLLALVSALTLIEPRRRATAAQLAQHQSTYLPIGQVMRVLAKKPTFWFLALGAAFASSVSYAHSFYLTSFWLRNHYDDVVRAAAPFGLDPKGYLGLATGLAAGIGGVAGSYMGGWWSDHHGSKDARHFLTLPLIVPFITTPIFWYALSISDIGLTMILMVIVNIGVSIWYGPVYGGVPGLVPPAMRATTSAVLLFIINIIGLGGGPTLFGMLSDFLANQKLAGQSVDGHALGVAFCSIDPGKQLAQCRAALAGGLHDAVYISTAVTALAILCWVLARANIRKDMES